MKATYPPVLNPLYRSEGIPLRDMLSLGALGMGPGWTGKIIPPPSPSSPTLALIELALTELALIELALIELALTELALIELALTELALIEFALTELLIFKKMLLFVPKMNQETIKVPCFQTNVVFLPKT